MASFTLRSSRAAPLRDALYAAFLLFFLLHTVCTAHGSEGTPARPYYVAEDCPARHLTEETFEHDTQASSGMTSGNWLILFVSSNDGTTSQHFSQQVVDEIKVFQDFVKLPGETLETYHVIPAYVLCDESPSLCVRFGIDKLPSKLVLLGHGRLYPYPADAARKVDDVELFVTIFRRIQSSAIPPVQPALAVWGQLVLLLAGVVGIVMVRAYAMNRGYGPAPKESYVPIPHPKLQ